MNDERRPVGGARTTSRRVHPNNTARRKYPRCPACGALAPTLELLRRHEIRDCHGGAQLNLDDALAQQTEGFDGWSIFNAEPNEH